MILLDCGAFYSMYLHVFKAERFLRPLVDLVRCERQDLETSQNVRGRSWETCWNSPGWVQYCKRMGMVGHLLGAAGNLSPSVAVSFQLEPGLISTLCLVPRWRPEFLWGPQATAYLASLFQIVSSLSASTALEIESSRVIFVPIWLPCCVA